MKEDKEIKTQEDGMNVEKLKTVADYLQTVTDLRTRLEEAEKELVYQKERYELQVLGSSTEISDLRTQLEEMMKKADAVGDAQFVIGVLTKNLNERNAENAALTKKLERVRKWADTRQADSVVKLRKIIDGETEGAAG